MANDKVVVAAIQARMGSKRLPSKVLREINGRPMIWYIYKRLCTVPNIDRVVLAIPDNEENFPLRAAAHLIGMDFITGSEDDLISRMYGTALLSGADALVRITGDCPLVDPQLVGSIVRVWRAYAREGNTEAEYVSNVQPRSFPKGLDVEIYSTTFLDRLERELKSSYYRESFTEYVWCMDDIRKLNVFSDGVKRSNLWWTVDYEDDLEFMENVYRKMGRDVFTMYEVLNELGEEAYYERELFSWGEGTFTNP